MIAENRTTLSSRQLWLIAGLLVVYMSGCMFLAKTRAPWYDEGFLVNPSYSWITTGYPGVSALDDSGPFLPWKQQVNMRGIRQHMYLEMPVYIAALAGWMKIFGFGLLSCRLLTVACGAVVLVAWYYVVRYLVEDASVAALTLALTSVDYAFLLRSSEARMDMMSAAFGFGGLAIYLYLRSRSFLWAVFLSNLCVSASAFTHPNGGMLAFAGLVFLVFYYDLRQIRFRHLTIALIPYLIGAAGWGWYISKDVESFRTQFYVNLTQTGRIDTFSAPLRTVKDEIEIRYLTYLGGQTFGDVHPGASSVQARSLRRLKLAIILAYIFGFVGVLAITPLRQHRGYRALLCLTGIYFLVLAFTDGHHSPMYIGHVIPLCQALVAGTAVWLWRNKGPLVRGALLAAAAVITVINLGGIAYHVRKNEYRDDYLPTISFLKQNVRGDQLLIGPGTLGFGLLYPVNLVDDFRLGAISGKMPDWIVVDDWWQHSWYPRLKVIEPTNYGFVRNRLDKEFDLAFQHGNFAVYRRN